MGRRVTDLEAATGGRVAFLIRFGTGLLPDAKTVIQAGDQVYMAAIAGHIAEALAIAALPPSEDSESQMKVAIAGAGAVGRSIARELVEPATTSRCSNATPTTSTSTPSRRRTGVSATPAS